MNRILSNAFTILCFTLVALGTAHAQNNYNRGQHVEVAYEGWEAMPRDVTYFQMLGRPLKKLDVDRLVSECSTYEDQKKKIRRAEQRSREGSIDEEAAVMRAIRNGNGDLFGL